MVWGFDGLYYLLEYGMKTSQEVLTGGVRTQLEGQTIKRGRRPANVKAECIIEYMKDKGATFPLHESHTR